MATPPGMQHTMQDTHLQRVQVSHLGCRQRRSLPRARGLAQQVGSPLVGPLLGRQQQLDHLRSAGTRVLGCVLHRLLRPASPLSSLHHRFLPPPPPSATMPLCERPYDADRGAVNCRTSVRPWKAAVMSGVAPTPSPAVTSEPSDSNSDTMEASGSRVMDGGHGRPAGKGAL